MAQRSPSSVLLIKLRHHGDVLLATPVSRVLKAQFPHCHIDFLVYEGTEALLENNPDIRHVWIWHRAARGWDRFKRILHLFFQLQHQHYDLIIHLSDQMQGALLARLLRPQQSIGIDYPKRRHFFWRSCFTRLAPLFPSNTHHTVEQNLVTLTRLFHTDGTKEDAKDHGASQNTSLARIFHPDSAAACEHLMDTASVSNCSSGSMKHTAVVAIHHLPCLHQDSRRLATNQYEICGLTQEPLLFQNSTSDPQEILGRETISNKGLISESPHHIVDPTLRCRLVISEKDRSFIHEQLQQASLATPYLLIHPTARWFFKCWEEESFARVIDHLATQGWSLLLTSGPALEEQAMITKILEKVHSERICSLAGKLTLGQLAAAIEGATLFIGVDSVPMHMAAALEKDIVALFGPSKIKEWHPWMTRYCLVKASDYGDMIDPDDVQTNTLERYLSTIPVEEVISKVETMLHGSRP